MKPDVTKPTLPLLVRWPCTCLLILAWAPLALVGWLAAGTGSVARRAADGVLDLIESLNG